MSKVLTPASVSVFSNFFTPRLFVSTLAQAALALLTRMRNYNEYLRETDAPRTNMHMSQLSGMLEQEAECLSNQLHDASLRRVAQRQSQMVVAA